MPARKLLLTKSFEKAFQKFIKNNIALKKNIQKTIQLMEADVFSPSLKTHKLSGNLYDLLACSCGYDCRIIFSIEHYPISNQEVILLIDIGKHNEVY